MMMKFAARWYQRRRDRGVKQSRARTGAEESPDGLAGCRQEVTGDITRPSCHTTECDDPAHRHNDSEYFYGFDAVLPPENEWFNLCDLPDEVLLRILAYIHPMEKTFISLMLSCKRLHRLSQDPYLYQLSSLRVPSQTMFSFYLLQRVFDVSGRGMVRVDLSGCEDITDYAFFRIAVQCRKLKQLSLSGCQQITNGGLRIVGNYLKQLERLDISGCPFITCSGVVHLFRMIGRSLTSINLNDCLGFREDPHKLASLATFCSSLRHLSVGWSRDLVKLNPLLDMDLDRLTQGCTDLEYLDVSYSHSTNSSMQSISLNCPSLTTLIAKQCFLQDTGLEHIGLGLDKLNWLDLTDCWYVSDVGLGSVANGCRLLRGIILTRCHEVRGSGIVKIACTCPKLETLGLRQCFRIDDHSIESVCFYAKQLRHLDVSFNQNVTVNTVRKIREVRGQDLAIEMEGCPRVPNGGAPSRFSFSKKNSTSLMIWETAV